MSEPFDHKRLRRQRADGLLRECMVKLGIDLWLIYTRESSPDPLGRDTGLDRVVARAAGLFSLNGQGRLAKRALVASYDTSPVEETGIFQEVLSYKQEGIAPHLKREVDKLQPKRVAINVSRDVPMADGLSHGMRQHLDEMLGEETCARFTSAERLIVTFRGRKLQKEREKLKTSVALTQRALASALSPEVIRPGRTREIDVGNHLREMIEAEGGEVVFTMVMVGPCRGHGDPTERIIEPGDLLRIDFGAKVEGYCSDIQRTAYVCKPSESGPPEEVGRLFDTTLKACRAGIAALELGSTGKDVDRAARAVITGAGYDEYPHATGHPIGLEAHEVGPILGPPWKERYGTSVEHPIEEGMVFAVEPAAYVDIPACGGVVQVGIEEDVEITDQGPKVIGTPQTDLILLPS